MRTLFLLIGLSSFGLNAQQVNLDSLWRVWGDADQSDSVRLNAIGVFSKYGYLYSQPDSAYYYSQLQFDFADSIGNLWFKAAAKNAQGISQTLLGKNEDAIALFLKTGEIYQSLDNSIGIASALNNVGIVYKNIGDNSKALEYYNKSLKIKESLNDTASIGSTLNNIGGIYTRLNDYHRAVEMLLKSLKIKEKTNNLREIPSTLGNLSQAYRFLGEYKKAHDCSTKGLAYYKESGNTIGVGMTYNDIGACYMAEGNLNKASEYFELALEIARSTSDKKSVAHYLLNLGSIYKDNGNFQKAMEYYMESLEIDEELGNNYSLSKALNNVGILFKLQGNYSEARTYFDRAIAACRDIEDRSILGASLINSANLSMVSGDRTPIDDLNLGLEIAEESESPKAIIKCLQSLGDYYRDNKDFRTAIEHYERSCELSLSSGRLLDNKFGTQSLFRTYLEMDAIFEARDLIPKLMSYQRRDLNVNFAFLPEYEKELYINQVAKDYDLIYDFALRHQLLYPELTDLAYNNSLLIKDVLLRSSTLMRNSILERGDTILSGQYKDWLALKRRIANSFSEGGDIRELEVIANELEKELTKSSQEFSEINLSHDLSWLDVQSGLKVGECAVEFVLYSSLEDNHKDTNDIKRYAALIVNKSCENPIMIPLFEENELERIIETFPGNNLSYIEQLYGTKENTKSALYDLIWKPMENALRGNKKIFVSPVGLLHKISFAALAKEQDVYLCDLYDFEIKSSSGKIAMPENVVYNENSTTTLFGGIDYNSDSTTSEIWSYLDGSLSETQQIEKILEKGKRDYYYFNQNNATEAQFKGIASKSNILHIATHGFFYANPDLVFEESVDEIESNQDLVFRGGRTGMGMNTFVKSRNPLMRSGLAFAGANDVWNRTDIDGEDGVLTAAEVATIDMRNTDLVVLSACETGLGDIKGSEGVYGLQRSFKMAGVKYLIMSLWQVPDKETAEFMTSFYKNLTETNDIKESFKTTQMEMRKKYDPYYWAAFVLVE